MNPMKMKLIKEILSHLSDKQGMSLKESLDESRKPKIPEELDLDKKEKPDILIESKEIEGMEPESNEEMSDEELEELISKLVRK